jgi:flagellar basal-body rod protein FlgB
MIEATLFDRAHLQSLKQALDVYARRHRVVAENIANVETAGYRAREFRFEELLRGQATKSLAGMRTDPHHLPVGRREVEWTTGRVEEQRGDYDNGTNDVDIDREMTSLATTDLSYRLATRLLSMKYRLLRGAVTGTLR